MLLAGDIGGTKTVLSLFDGTGDELRPVRDGTFPSQGHATFQEILAQFLGGRTDLGLCAACFGVAGPIVDGHCKTTNLPWELDEGELARAVGAQRVKLLNDLEAAAYGMLFLRPDELAPLNPDAAPRRNGNVAVLAAGTGLGEAILYWDGRRYHPLASEGGHADFAPQDEREIQLLRWLRAKFGGHVSYERILSGPGLFNVFCFLRETGSYQESPALAGHLRAAADPSAAVTRLGLAGEDPLCVATLDMFCALYGAEAGNLALKCMALGGVFVGGGIAPKILPALQRGGFVKAYLDKGRFGTLLRTLPVSVALNPRAPLLGAAHYAAGMD